MRLSYPPFLYALIASALAIGLGFALGDTALQQAHNMVRWTARVGMPLVVIIYAASALHTLWPGAITTSTYKNRRSWGLSFALTHTFHLFAIFHYLATPGSVDPGPLGILGFAMIYLMAFSSNSNSIKRLGKWWKRIHTAGVHIIWFYYLVAYSEKLLIPEERLLGAIMVPMLLAALAIRIAAWLKSRKPSAGATTA